MTHNTFLNFLSSSSAPGATNLERELIFFTMQQPTNFDVNFGSDDDTNGLKSLIFENFQEFCIKEVMQIQDGENQGTEINITVPQQWYKRTERIGEGQRGGRP